MLPAGLIAFDRWTLAALGEACRSAPATADEVAHVFNATIVGLPRQCAQGMAQTLLRLHRLGYVDVSPTIFGVNAYHLRPRS